MGSGGGGGKSGGGGRKARPGAGAGGTATTGTDVFEKDQHLKPSDVDLVNSDKVTLAAYSDVPPIVNSNRTIVDGQVVVGPKGAPTINPKDRLSFNDSYDLVKSTGVPEHYLNKLANLGDEAMQDVAQLLKGGWKWQGGGAEGAVWAKGDKVMRFQINGREPLNHFAMGPLGMYSEWKQRYGTVMNPVWVEQKPRIYSTAGRLHSLPEAKKEAAKQNLIANVKKFNKKLGNEDLHQGNWGWDSKGRPRVIDPGAMIPPGFDVLAGGWN